MPIITIPPITPLSSTWTVKKVVSQIRIMINELDNERIQNTNIRNHMNIAIAQIADLLNTAQKPDYGVSWVGQIEATVHDSGLDWIDLSTPVAMTASNAWENIFPQNSHTASGEIIPVSHLWQINYITSTIGQQAVNADVLRGNCTLLSLSEITQLVGGLNDQYRQSICYKPHGNMILMYFGEQITSASSASPDFDTTFYERPDKFVIWAYRQPILDNLIPESEPTTSSWDKYVDVPDRHMRLLMMIVQKACLEQLSKQVDAGLEQNIAMQIQQIQGTIAADIQMQQAERTKAKQGFTTR